MEGMDFTPQHSSLTSQIFDLVDWFGCVETDLIHRFFKNQASQEVLRKTLNEMIYSRLLFVIDETRLSTVPKLAHAEEYYDATNAALHVMCDNFTSEEIDCYMTGIDVIRLKFHTVYGDSYDVVSFPATGDYSTVLTRALQARKMDTIPGRENIYSHIAVVPDLELGSLLTEFNFSYFAVLDRTNFTKLYAASNG